MSTFKCAERSCQGIDIRGKEPVKVRCFLSPHPELELGKYQKNHLGNYYVHVDAFCFSMPAFLCEGCINRWATQQCRAEKLFDELRSSRHLPEPRFRPFRKRRTKENHAHSLDL